MQRCRGSDLFGVPACLASAGEVVVQDSALPWLLRTADYVVRNERRGQRFRWANTFRHSLASDEPDHADRVAARIDDEQDAKRLRALLRKLPRPEREIVELCFWTGLDAQAAAVVLDVPLGTVSRGWPVPANIFAISA